MLSLKGCHPVNNNNNICRELIMTKSSAPLAPRSQGISLPNKQDVFVGFATVPGFVSFTSSLGSPYLQVRNTLKVFFS